MIVFHGTNTRCHSVLKAFTNFGSMGAAIHRIREKLGGSGFIYLTEVLDNTICFVAQDDADKVDIFSILRDLRIRDDRQLRGIDYKFCNDVLPEEFYRKNETMYTAILQREMLRQKLKWVKYRNKVEDPGSWSYLNIMPVTSFLIMPWKAQPCS